MSENNSNLSSITREFNIIDFLNSIDYRIYQFEQVLEFIYTLICVFWLVYAIYRLFLRTRKSKNYPNLSIEHNYLNRIFTRREMIFRYYIFLVVLCFELIYSLTVNFYGILISYLNYQNTSIPIGPNCTLDTWTVIGSAYDGRFGIVALHICFALGDFSFSMIIWLFGVSLFHLSFAARNELRVNAVIRYFLLGLVIYLVLMIFVLIPYTSIFGIMAQSVMDQISILIAFYIMKRRFFPAMNSRVIDAFHFNNVRVYLEQKRLLNRYKVLICFLICTFEIYALKNLVLYNLYVVFESICLSPCWFNVTYHLPTFALLDSTKYILHQISVYFKILEHLADVIVYINILLVNLLLIYCINRIPLNRMLCRKKKYRYRYHVFSSPLLSNNE